MKSAVLHLLAKGSSIKSDERYPGLVTSLCAILRSPSDSPAHIQVGITSVVPLLDSVDDLFVCLQLMKLPSGPLT
jgi:hypothetical protein